MQACNSTLLLLLITCMCISKLNMNIEVHVNNLILAENDKAFIKFP